MIAMKVYNFLKTFLMKCFYYRRRKKFSIDLTLSEINDRFKVLDIYLYLHHWFLFLAPDWLKEHRVYFKEYNRGFGEDAFHAMWFKLFQEYNPKNILEIGVYRGQTLSLFTLLSLRLNYESDVFAISPFTNAGDSVSSYLKNLDYYKDVINNFNYFNLPLPRFFRGFSTDPNIIDDISSKKFDLIYIDGNHDYIVAKHDFDVYSKMLVINGLIVLDDASLYTSYTPPFFSTAGHDGPSRVANEISKDNFKEIICVGHNRVFQKISF